MTQRSRGRPPKGDEAMMQPITIRLPQAMMDAIEAEVEKRKMEGVDKATVIREWIARGMRP